MFTNVKKISSISAGRSGHPPPSGLGTDKKDINIFGMKNKKP